MSQINAQNQIDSKQETPKASGVSSADLRAELRSASDEKLLQVAQDQVKEELKSLPGVSFTSKIAAGGLIEINLNRADGATNKILLNRFRLGGPEGVSALVQNGARILQDIPAVVAPVDSKPAEEVAPAYGPATSESLKFVRDVAEFVRSDKYKNAKDDEKEKLLTDFIKKHPAPDFSNPYELAEAVYNSIASEDYSGKKPNNFSTDLPKEAKLKVVQWFFNSVKDKKEFQPDASKKGKLEDDPVIVGVVAYLSVKFYEQFTNPGAGTAPEKPPSAKKLLFNYFKHHLVEYKEWMKLARQEAKVQVAGAQTAPAETE